MNGEIIRQLYKEVNSRRRPPHILHKDNNGLNRPAVLPRTSSLKIFYRFFTTVREAFPDYEIILDNLIVKEDKVMVRYTISGVHKGDFMGLAATYERMVITGVDVFRLDQGQVIEYWDAAHQITASPELPAETSIFSDSWRPGGMITTPSGRKPKPQYVVHR